MQHINCTAGDGQDVINNTLIAPCIRGPHSTGPTVEEGATPEEVQQRATSRESLETYSHILIDMSDILQEMVRYMNQYARLLHRDPPLDGGSLTHAQNLVDRMGAMFHEVSHAFHMLSDFSITLNSSLPRRLWMAQLTGAHLVLSREEGVSQQLQQELTRLRNQMRQTVAGGGGPGTATSTTSNSGTSSTSASSTTSTTTASSNRGASGTTNGSSGIGASGTTNSSSGTGAAATGGNGGSSNQPFSISFDIPLGGNVRGPPHSNIQQLFQQNRAAGPAPTGNQPVPRPSLMCNSRHRIFTPIRCAVHQPGVGGGPPPAPPLGATRGRHSHRPHQGHSHSHGPRHSHSHGPAPPRQAGAARTTSTTSSSTSTTGAARQSGASNATPTSTTQNSGNNTATTATTTTTSGTSPTAGGAVPPNLMALFPELSQDPEQMRRYMNLAMQMMMGSRQNQPMVAHWPEIRALMVPSVTIPEHSAIGELLYTVASHHSFQEFMNGLNNNMLFDILFRHLRDHFTLTLFNEQIPSASEISSAVSQMISADRDLIIAFFDIRQDENTDVDEKATVIAMVKEFVSTVFQELYNPIRGNNSAGFGAVFGQACLRFLGLIVAYCRFVNPDDPRNRFINQLTGFLQSMVPFHTIERDELFDNYVVRRGSEDTEDEEFVDAEEGEAKKDEDSMETETEDSSETSTEGVAVSNSHAPPENSSVNNDVPSPAHDNDLPDDVVERALPVLSNGHINGAEATEIPSDWKRVIEEDTAKLENSTFQPLSDGYLTSLPAKRRKTDTKQKSDNPDDLLKDLITKSLPENEQGEMSHDAELSEMFKDKLKKDLAKKVKDNDDVNEEQFPCTSSLKNNN